MKKLPVLLAILTSGIFMTLVTDVALAADSAATSKRVSPQKLSSPPSATPTKINPLRAIENKAVRESPVATIRRADITNLEIGTEPAGSWFWRVTVKNTGTASLKMEDIGVQGFNTPSSGMQPPSPPTPSPFVELAPNSSTNIKRTWVRNCNTDGLRVELKDKTTNTLWDTALLSNLNYKPALNQPEPVFIRSIEWDDSNKKWKATVENGSNYVLIIKVYGVLWEQGYMSQDLVGDQTFTLQPNAQATTWWLPASQAQHGDVLKVHKKFINFNSGHPLTVGCSSQANNNITIPNSRVF